MISRPHKNMCSLIRALEMMEQIGEICFVSREIDTSIAKVALSDSQDRLRESSNWKIAFAHRQHEKNWNVWSSSADGAEGRRACSRTKGKDFIYESLSCRWKKSKRARIVFIQHKEIYSFPCRHWPNFLVVIIYLSGGENVCTTIQSEKFLWPMAGWRATARHIKALVKMGSWWFVCKCLRFGIVQIIHPFGMISSCWDINLWHWISRLTLWETNTGRDRFHLDWNWFR